MPKVVPLPAARAPIAEDVEAGPTASFKQHHDITSSKSGGSRVLSRLEQMLEKDLIDAPACEAGRRFASDYMRGYVGSSKSCLVISIRGNGGTSFSDSQHDAASRFDRAAHDLNANKALRRNGMDPAQAVLLLAVEDLAFNMIARSMGLEDRRTAQSRLSDYLAHLAGYYGKLDAENGRDRTAQRKGQALSRFDPDVDA